MDGLPAPADPLDDRDPLDVERLRERLHEALDEFCARQARALARVSPECAPLVETVAALIRGGKRLRPAFCYWGWRGAGGDDVPAAVAAAAALELFQAAALIHDDVMDDSDLRRGMPAAHRRFATLHRSSGWNGDGDRFGLAGAVLAGDLCLIWSDELLVACGMDATALARGRVVFDRMRTQLMGGQYLDMLEQALAGRNRRGSVERARRVIRYKSAKYTVEEPLLLGGALAGAPDDLLRSYSAYGLPLGEAFQLRDDVLGVFGDPAATGKPAGDDLREGKRTVLVAMALERSTRSQAAAIERLLGDPGLEEAGVDTLREVIISTGALSAVEALVGELAEQARAALAASAVTGAARDVLDRLVGVVTARTT